MNHPNDYTTQLHTYRQPELRKKHSWPSLYTWAVIFVIAVAAAAVISLGLIITGHTSSPIAPHILKVQPTVAAKSVSAPVLKPAEKVAKNLGGTDIVGSSASEMQSVNSGDSAGMLADYANFKLNGVKYIVLVFTGPTTKDVGELGFAEAGLNNPAYSGPTWLVYTQAKWDMAQKLNGQ